MCEKEEALKHFPEAISNEIKAYVKEHVMEKRYIFVERKAFNRGRRGYCTYCNCYSAVNDEIKSGTIGKCEKCGTICIYKHAWRGRKSLIERAAFLYFEKSLINEQVVTATWYMAENIYIEKYVGVETHIRPYARYIFDCTNNKVCMLESYWNPGIWIASEHVTTPEVLRSYQDKTVAIQTIEPTIRGTKLQYGRWTAYTGNDILRYFEMFLKYPSVEILSKSNNDWVIKAKMYGARTYRAINWKATKLHHIFKMSKQDYELLQGYEYLKGKKELFLYWLCQQARKEKSKIPFKDLLSFAGAVNLENNLGIFDSLREQSTIHRIVNYTMKIFESDQAHYGRPAQVMITWRDYLEDCVKLNLDLTDDAVCYPKKLAEKHQETMKKIKHVENEKLKQAMLARKQQLENFHNYTNGEFIILVPGSAKEIINEGSKLSHCVGNYADRHIKGQTTILFVRKVSEIDRPFYTIEILDNEVKQLRGNKNAPAPAEVKSFVESFKKEKLKKNKRKARKIA